MTKRRAINRIQRSRSSKSGYCTIEIIFQLLLRHNTQPQTHGAHTIILFIASFKLFYIKKNCFSFSIYIFFIYNWQTLVTFNTHACTQYTNEKQGELAYIIYEYLLNIFAYTVGSRYRLTVMCARVCLCSRIRALPCRR